MIVDFRVVLWGMQSHSHDLPEINPEYKSLSREVVHQLPKVVLHDHLDGGLRPATIVELAATSGYSGLPTTDPEKLGQWFFDAANSGSLPQYLETFAHTCAVMQTEDAIERVAREAVEDLAADGVVYAELRFAPEQHQEQGLTLQQVVDAAVRGCKAGEQSAQEQGHVIIARLILCGMRHAARTQEIAELTVQNCGPDSPDSYVVAFDIAGAEDGFSPDQHAEAFTLLRDNFVPFTVHAGEAAGEESIAAAMRQGACRLGHGARVYEDFGVDAENVGIKPGHMSSFIRDRGTVLELCPTSNVQTGVVDDIADHPLPLLHQLGFACTVNTDNRLVSGTTMTDEMMVLVDVFGYDLEGLFELTTTAIDAAFLPVLQRREIYDTLIVPGYAKFAAEQDHQAGHTVNHDHERINAADLHLDEETLAMIDPQMLEELGIDPKDLSH